MLRPLRAINRLKRPGDLWLFTRILFELIILPRRIRQQSLPDLLAQLDPGVAPVHPDQAKLLKTVGFVESLLRYRILRRYGICMMRSLVLFKFLRRQGWPVEIHFGVRKIGESEPDITGHSWLVLGGEAFLEDPEKNEYVTTFKY